MIQLDRKEVIFKETIAEMFLELQRTSGNPLNAKKINKKKLTSRNIVDVQLLSCV